MAVVQSRQQIIQRVQNQALQIITGAIKSKLIERMEATTGIPSSLKKGGSAKP
jgi:hypothetical protein